MSFRDKLQNFIFFRSLFTVTGQRSPYAAKTTDFSAYFQYKIGDFQKHYYLYFRKQLYLQLYKNEIFNKMYEYTGYDLIRYLEFHYEAFEDKADFIRFLHYEVTERIRRKSPKYSLLKLETTADWTMEKQKEQKELNEAAFKAEIEQDVRSTLAGQVTPGPDMEVVIQSLSEKLASRLEQLVSDTQDKMTSMTDSMLAGNVQVNNHNHLEKLIQVYILILQLEAPAGAANAGKLFKRFSHTDLASILHLHFQEFKDKKFNTVQVKITDCADRLKINNPKVQNLDQALEAFFY
jgi:hypothetical protein